MAADTTNAKQMDAKQRGLKQMDLKQRLASPSIILAPGVYDALIALIAEQAGFEALYLSGASIAYARLGRSDVGLTSYSEVEQTLSRITDRVSLPVIVDADTGFGNALNVVRTVKGFEKAGAAMIQLEDQTFPKRCGHLDGKTVVPIGEMAGKLDAALDARTHASTLILARTDAVAVEGLDAALDRAEVYLERGADALFIEAVRSPAQMEAVCKRFAARVPLLVNLVEGGKTPIQPVAALQAYGFRIAIFPGGTARAVAHTLQGYFASLRENGTTAPWQDRMLDFDGLNQVIGTPELIALGKRYEEPR